MIAHNLEYTSEGMLDVINDLFDYAKVNDVPFYMVTSSSRQAIDAWTESTGAAYPYLLADETLLKTIIRSNPGLLILKNASVLGKWSAADMPRDVQLTLPIEQNEVLRQSTRYTQGRIAKVVLWMFLPLLLLLVMDKKKVNKKDISSINNLKT
jgi:triosephosphate isomerase